MSDQEEHLPFYEELVAKHGDPYRQPELEVTVPNMPRGKRQHAARKARKAADEVVARASRKDVVDSPGTGSTDKGEVNGE